MPSGRRYLPFIAYRGTYTPPADFGRPNTAVLCRLLPVLLLGNGHSRHYLRNPRMVVRPCPLASPRCIRPFLPREPENIGLASGGKQSLQCNFYKGLYLMAAVIPLGSGPILAKLSQLAPTAVVQTPHACYLPPRCGIATCLNRTFDMTGPSPAGLQPCRPLRRHPEAICIFSYLSYPGIIIPDTRPLTVPPEVIYLNVVDRALLQIIRRFFIFFQAIRVKCLLLLHQRPGPVE